MSFPAMSGEELMSWVEQTSAGWRQLIDSHPEALTLPCDIRETSSVGQLLQHIVAVELRYAERLSGLPVTSYDAISYASSEALFQTHDRA